MTFLAKLKMWLLIGGAAAGIILALLLRVFTLGSNSAKAENAIALGKAREKFDERINKAHTAGDTVRRESADGVHDLRADDGYKRKRKTK